MNYDEDEEAEWCFNMTVAKEKANVVGLNKDREKQTEKKKREHGFRRNGQCPRRIGWEMSWRRVGRSDRFCLCQDRVAVLEEQQRCLILIFDRRRSTFCSWLWHEHLTVSVNQNTSAFDHRKNKSPDHRWAQHRSWTLCKQEECL